MNIEQKNTLFIVLLIMVVLVATGLIAIVIIDDHIYNEADKELESAFHIGKSQLDKQNMDLLESANYLVTKKEFRVLAQKNNLKEIKRYLETHQEILKSDLGLFYVENNGIQYSAGFSSRAVFRSRRVIELNEYLNLVKKVREIRKPVKAFLFVDDEIINSVAVPIIFKQKLLGVYMQGTVVSNRYLQSLKKLHRVESVLYKPNAIFGNTNTEFSFSLGDITKNVPIGQLSKIDVAGEAYYSKSFALDDSLHDKPRLFMLLSVSADEKRVPYIVMLTNATYAGLLVMLLAALIAIQISRSQLSKPIKDLVLASHAIGGGDLNTEVLHHARKDELGDLAESLEHMRSNIVLMQHDEKLINSRISDFADISSDWLWETDMMGNFSYLSASVSDSIGFTVDQLLHKNVSDIFVHDNLSELSILSMTDSAAHKGFKNTEVWVTTQQGYRICLRFNATPYFVDSVFKGYRGTASDITKSKNDEDRLLRLANKDHLTGLSNRTRFMEDLEREMNIAVRQQTRGALLLIDLDHFKLINDTAGHAAGDEVIVQIAGLLRKVARNIDLIARLSGDEFVIAFINTEADAITPRVTELVKKINQLKPMYSGKIMNTSASIGVAIFPDHADSAVELLAKADTAMYEAKSGGRNRIHIYEPGDMQQEKMGSDLVWKDRVHDALESEKFVLAFQPIKPTTGEDPFRYEVLVRMKSSSKNLFYPGDFIPTAEKFGLIRELDTWVVRQALSVLSRLPASYSHISFTINLSGLSVGEPAMLDLIKNELEKSNIDRNRVIFEVTESAAFQDITRAIEFIDKIKDLGCRIALDDFGVGFSSFSYLKQLHANILKIDGSFIRDINNSRDDQLFVKALVDVARGMGMMTVAEFVESAEVYETVRGLGVDYVQGYYIGKPKVGFFDDIIEAEHS